MATQTESGPKVWAFVEYHCPSCDINWSHEQAPAQDSECPCCGTPQLAEFATDRQGNTQDFLQFAH